MPPAFNLSQDQTLQFKPVTVFGSFEPVAHSKLTGHMNCFINLTYFSVRLLILLLSRSEDQVSLTSSAHTYRLLVFKEHVCEQIVLLSSAALSAAEKRDYEHCFAARQQLFYYIVATAGFFFLRRAGAHAAAHVRLRFPFRAAFPLARKRRDSMHPTSNAQAVCENIFKRRDGPQRLPASSIYTRRSRHGRVCRLPLTRVEQAAARGRVSCRDRIHTQER
ncbi:hypothetical protein FEP63_00856 [Burkholderia multivorans]|nr:hypothetical protein [Burkholderia multivorans]